MKKYVQIAICVILIIFAMVIASGGSAKQIAGKGDGKSEEVESLKMFGSILSSFGGEKIVLSDGTSVVLNEDGSLGKAYDSFTVQNKQKSTVYLRYGSTTTISITDTVCTVYFDGECYYETSKGNMYINNNSIALSYIFDMDMLVSEGGVYMRARKFDESLKGGGDSEHLSLNPSVYNKWVDVTEYVEILNSNLNMYELVLQSMSATGQLLTSIADKPLNSRKEYNANKDEILSFFSTANKDVDISINDESLKGSLVISLANAVAPKITASLSYGGSTMAVDPSGLNEIRINYSASVYSSSIYTNINNTRVDTDIDVFDMDDIGDIFA